MRQALQRAWLRRGLLAWLLLPLSGLYGAVALLHRMLYRSGLRRSQRLPVPVVMVGNVVAGGAGKTPVVMALLAHLRERGVAAGVVSRGYGRSGADAIEVHAGDAAQRTGDEPLLVKRSCGVPVFVAGRRADAALALLRAYPATQVIVSDDGLQHHALARDIEVCVFDARGTGNGWLLPAGPLREAWPRPVDLVLAHGGPPGIAGHVLQRKLAAHAVRADGSRCSLGGLASAGDIHAVAGIAQPESFFAMLREAGVALAQTHALPDHHDFDAGLPLPADATLVCTEKDAVKLWRSRPDAWAVPLQVTLPAAFIAAFDRLLDARLSSAHGSPPA
ncbi:tetraacyldisaccharide 4'-kinase [Ramlibacter sp. PS3R-8]|uniref:tetraacyldisaccharide 4'-kinase n=1 Tax=Ramlibacter sp. PS3R-8 TaxID=3133437 RepID=UPI0030AD1E84